MQFLAYTVSKDQEMQTFEVIQEVVLSNSFKMMKIQPPTEGVNGMEYVWNDTI